MARTMVSAMSVGRLFRQEAIPAYPDGAKIRARKATDRSNACCPAGLPRSN